MPYSVIIKKEPEKAVAQIPVSLRGQNCTLSPAEYLALVWRVAVDGRLMVEDTDMEEYDCEIVNLPPSHRK